MGFFCFSKDTPRLAIEIIYLYTHNTADLARSEYTVIYPNSAETTFHQCKNDNIPPEFRFSIHHSKPRWPYGCICTNPGKQNGTYFMYFCKYRPYSILNTDRVHCANRQSWLTEVINTYFNPDSHLQISKTSRVSWCRLWWRRKRNSVHWSDSFTRRYSQWHSRLAIKIGDFVSKFKLDLCDDAVIGSIELAPVVSIINMGGMHSSVEYI